MNKTTLLIFALVVIFSTKAQATNFNEQLLGCWKSTNKPSTICYLDDGSMYINEAQYTMHGDWHVKNESIFVTLSAFKTTVELKILSFSEKKISYSSTRNNTVDIDERVAYQAPITKRKTSVTSANKKIAPAMDMARMLTNSKAKYIGNIKGDLLIKRPHCITDDKEFYNTISNALSKKGVIKTKELVGSFFSLICQAEQNSALSKVTTKHDFFTSHEFYSGMKKLGDWSCKVGKDKSQEISFMNIFSTKNQATRWQTSGDRSVNIWLANFDTAPSDANTFNMSYHNNEWQLNHICYSSRL